MLLTLGAGSAQALEGSETLQILRVHLDGHATATAQTLHHGNVGNSQMAAANEVGL
jgi:hypothetical protein